MLGWLERWGVKAGVPFPLPLLSASGFTGPRGVPHLHVFIGGSCLLRVLVMEFEGELCLHHSWRDALGQQRRPTQGLSFAPFPPQSEARPWGGWTKRVEANGPQLHSDGCPVSSSGFPPPKLPLMVITVLPTIYRAPTRSQENDLQNGVSLKTL